MSLSFRWPSADLIGPILDKLKQKLNEKLLVVTDGVDPALMEPVQIHEITLGDVAPDLQISRLEALSEERICLDIYIKYCGNAHVTITTQLQLNKLYQRGGMMDLARDTSTMGRGILSRTSMDSPLMFTVHSIDLEGTITIDLRPKQKKLKITLDGNPVRSMGFSNNFESDVSMLGNLLNSIASKALKKALDTLASKPQEIDLSAHGHEKNEDGQPNEDQASKDENNVNTKREPTAAETSSMKVV